MCDWLFEGCFIGGLGGFMRNEGFVFMGGGVFGVGVGDLRGE